MSEVIRDDRVRSNNKNVFRYSSYFHTWSRILFHDPVNSRGMQNMRQRYNIPDAVKIIEIDLTPSSPIKEQWDRISTINIRCHSTFLARREVVTGSIPIKVFDIMKENLPERTVELLLHGNYLPYLDFSKHNPLGGGESFEQKFLEPVSLRHWCNVKKEGGGPGVFDEDVSDGYDEYVADYNNKIAALKP